MNTRSPAGFVGTVFVEFVEDGAPLVQLRRPEGGELRAERDDARERFGARAHAGSAEGMELVHAARGRYRIGEEGRLSA